MKKGLIFVLFALVSIVSYSQISWNAKVGMNTVSYTHLINNPIAVVISVLAFRISLAAELREASSICL